LLRVSTRAVEERNGFYTVLYALAVLSAQTLI